MERCCIECGDAITEDSPNDTCCSEQCSKDFMAYILLGSGEDYQTYLKIQARKED